MIIFNKKDLVIPRGLGNVAVAVTSGYTDSISREEVEEMIDEAISGHTAGVASINGETGDVSVKTINNQSIIGQGDINIETGGVQSETITTIWTGTLDQYDALPEHRSDTLYFINFGSSE